MNSFSTTSIDNPNKLESYLPRKVIGRGSRSVVYLATCTRGRLHGRNVAIKAYILSHSILVSENSPKTAIRSLHHPALVSLHSSFKDSCFHYLVLELCEGGSLCKLIKNPSRNGSGETTSTLPLSEAHLRPILRRIVEGVSYLHTQNIIHGDIRPHNVLITGDGRIKLGLGLSPLTIESKPDKDSEVSHKILCKRSNYAAPETATDGPCSFASDLWSLGCLIVTVLTGTYEFEHMKFDESFKFSTELILSPQAQDLAYGLLKLDPQQRTPLKKVLAHAFLDPSLPHQSLDIMKTFTDLNDLNRYSQDAESVSEMTPGDPVHSGIQSLNDGNKDDLKISASSGLTCRMPSASVSTTTAAINATQETLKASPRPLLYSTSSERVSSGIQDAWTRLSSRQVLNNHNRLDSSKSPAVAEATELKLGPLKMGRKALGEVGNLTRPLRPCATSMEKVPVNIRGSKEQSDIPSGLLSPPVTQLGQCSLHEGGLWDVASIPSSVSSGKQRSWEQSPHFQQKDVMSVPSRSMSPYKHNIPIPRISSPKSLQVAPLFPQTYKIAHGQLVILSSRNLLVDLREGDRRAGGRGDRILCITPDGQEIKVYEAPHLSTPCVLSEPREIWTLNELPVRYWESYTFASKYLESVKKRTPWMVWYTPQAMFTLMSNGPKGDIHLSFPCPSHGVKKQCHVSGALSESFVRMKIKFSRQQDSLELSRYTPSYKQRGRGEWITKSEPMAVERLKLGGDFMLNFTPEERQGLACLIEGVKLAEAAEKIYMVARPCMEAKDSMLDDIAIHPLKLDVSGKLVAIGSTPQRDEATPISDTKATTPIPAQQEIHFSMA